VPSDLVLNTRTLAAISRKLTTDDIGTLVQELIDELDHRAGDIDAESEILEDSP
jgi:hypothetical protein